MNPDVLVIPKAFVKAYPTIPDRRRGRSLLPLEDVLDTRWDTDAHVVGYRVKGRSHGARLRKTVDLDRVECVVTFMDWDIRPKRPSTLKDIEEMLSQVPSGVFPTHVYQTKHGARLVYVHRPIDPLTQERFQLYLHEALGFTDQACKEWNRLFRLPNVVRDGEPLKGEVMLNYGPVYDVADFDLPEHPGVAGFMPLQQDQPDGRDAHSLIWTLSSAGRTLVPTPWAREAKRRMKHRVEGEAERCFDKDAIPLPEPRNPAIMRIVGSLTSMLYGQLDTTPAHIYGLILPRVEQSQRDDGRDLRAEAWKMICYCWAREEALIEKREERKETVERELGPDVATRLAVRVGRGRYFVLHRSGLYDPLELCRDMLPGAIQKAGVAEELDPSLLTVVTNRGLRPKNANELLRDHVLALEPPIVKRPGPRGGFIEDRSLVFGSYTRAAHTPSRSEAVEAWLKALAGPRYEDLCRWIGLALAFERGPICALSLQSPPGVGKGMLVQGLVEATSPAKVGSGSVFGKWQYALDETPWIHVDEAWPDVPGLSAAFRRLVSGAPVQVEQKYQAPRTVQCAPRVIVTANNRGPIERLFRGRDVGKSDVQAIAQRVFHLDLEGEAADHLRDRGSYLHTRGWIAGYNSEPSDYTLARHFLWLHRQHGQDPAMGRFLLEGLTEPALVAWLSMKSPHISNMAHALLILYNQGKHEDGWVKVGDVHRTLREHAISRKEYTLMEVGRHLRLLTSKSSDSQDRRRKIDMQKLSFYANETGKSLEVAT